MSSFLDPTTLQPPRFGQVYCDRSITATGQAQWAGNNVTTSGVAVFLAPSGGGALAVCQVPDGSYALPADGYSLWTRLYRTAGTTTLINGSDIIIYNNTAIPTPTQDWIPLFTRYAGNAYAYGGLIVPPNMGPLGGAKSSDYEYVVSNNGDLRATHTSIAAAIQAASDGQRILVLASPLPYNAASASNGGVDNAAAFAWTGKTVTLEGEGWGTQIVNTGSLTRAFGIQSGASGPSSTLGNGSRVLNLCLSGFAQAVRFDGNSYGLRNCVVDIWQGNTTTFTDPSTTGGGTIDDNEVKLHCYSCTSLTPVNLVRHYMVGGSSQVTETANVALSLLASGAPSSTVTVTTSPYSAKVITGSATPTYAPIGSGAGAGYVVATDNAQNVASLAYNAQNVAGSVVLRDSNGAFSAGNISAAAGSFTSLSSTSTLSHTGLSASNFTHLYQGNALVVNATTGGQVYTLPYTNVDTANTIVARDGSGNFSAGTITANFVGGTLTLGGLTQSNKSNVLVTGATTGGVVYTYPVSSLSVSYAATAGGLSSSTNLDIATLDFGQHTLHQNEGDGPFDPGPSNSQFYFKVFSGTGGGTIPVTQGENIVLGAWGRWQWTNPGIFPYQFNGGNGGQIGIRSASGETIDSVVFTYTGNNDPTLLQIETFSGTYWAIWWVVVMFAGTPPAAGVFP